FATHPSNTFQSMALACVEERAVVEITEVLRSEILRVPVEIRGKVDLGLHREVLSHPFRIQWRDRGVEALVARHGHVLDNRAALVLRVKRPIDAVPVRAGVQVTGRSIPAPPAMPHSVEAIWRESMNEEALPLIPPRAELFVQVGRYHAEYLQQLETA